MIIFYDKDTGKITGTIHGRVHTKEELNMFIGDPTNNKRLVCQWVQKKDGKWIPEKQKEMFIAMEQDKMPTRRYKVDVTKGKVIHKSREEIDKEEKAREERRKKIEELRKNPPPTPHQQLENRVKKLEEILLNHKL